MKEKFEISLSTTAISASFIITLNFYVTAESYLFAHLTTFPTWLKCHFFWPFFLYYAR